MNEDYTARFSGVARLYGERGLQRLHDAHVCVVGVGGVGSWTVEGLARSGVGALTLIDLDEVCVTNVNRQLPAMDGEIGRAKVTVLAERVKRINPGCRVTALADFFTASTADDMLSGGFDLVVDAIDNVGNKARLLAECVRRNLRCVTVGGAGGKRDATGLKIADLGESGGDDLLKQVRKRLRKEHGFTAGEDNRYGIRAVWSIERPVFPWANGTCATEPEPGSSLKLDCSNGFGTAVFVTAAFGLAAAQASVEMLVSD